MLCQKMAVEKLASNIFCHPCNNGIRPRIVYRGGSRRADPGSLTNRYTLGATGCQKLSLHRAFGGYLGDVLVSVPRRKGYDPGDAR
jgi:hypothetical protein